MVLSIMLFQIYIKNVTIVAKFAKKMSMKQKFL